mgnify:CR=1 FL=1
MKYNYYSKRIQSSKLLSKINGSFDIGINNTLKTLDKRAKNDRLYEEGYKWFEDGKDLEDATEVIDYFGQKIVKKEQRNFKHGFFEGIKKYGNICGINKMGRNELPEKYANNEIFIGGYNDAISTVGYNFGRKGYTRDSLPQKLVGDEIFIKKYEEGIKRYGYEFGYKGVTANMLPPELVNEVAFLEGYRDGIEKRASVAEKKAKRR